MVLELMMNSRCDFETFSIYPVQGLNVYCKASKYFKIDIITMSVKVYSIYNQKSYISFKQALSERNPWQEESIKTIVDSIDGKSLRFIKDLLFCLFSIDYRLFRRMWSKDLLSEERLHWHFWLFTVLIQSNGIVITRVK